MYTEADYIMLSALQHYLYCPRQCALIHLEQVWVENRYTAEGRVLHERADSREKVTEGRVRTVRTLPIRSAATRSVRAGRCRRVSRGRRRLSRRVQARQAEGQPLRRGAALRPGALSGRDAGTSGQGAGRCFTGRRSGGTSSTSMPSSGG